MRCGICGSDNPTYESRSRWGKEVVTVLPVYDSRSLNTHKQQQHPDEYKASLQRRKDTKAEHERADLDYRQRRQAAGDAAGRTVLFQHPYEDLKVEVTTTRRIDSYHRLVDYRYPEPVTFALYQAHLLEIKRLQALADIALEDAFAHGSPVPQEDVDRVKAAMDAVVMGGAEAEHR